jgi:hypothetical protein
MSAKALLRRNIALFRPTRAFGRADHFQAARMLRCTMSLPVLGRRRYPSLTVWIDPA